MMKNCFNASTTPVLVLSAVAGAKYLYDFNGSSRRSCLTVRFKIGRLAFGSELRCFAAPDFKQLTDCSENLPLSLSPVFLTKELNGRNGCLELFGSDKLSCNVFHITEPVGVLRAPLARAAVGTKPAGAGADDFAGAAVGAGYVHVHVAEGDFYALGVGGGAGGVFGVAVAVGVGVAIPVSVRLRGGGAFAVSSWVMRSMTSSGWERARSETGRLTAFLSISASSFMGRSAWPLFGLVASL